MCRIDLNPKVAKGPRFEKCGPRCRMPMNPEAATEQTDADDVAASRATGVEAAAYGQIMVTLLIT